MVAPRMTPEQFAAHQAKVNRKSKAALFSDVIAGVAKSKDPKKTKYGNIAEIADGRRFASRKELRRYHDLNLLLKSGTIHVLCTQPRIILPSGIVYVADFLHGVFQRNDVFEDMATLERVIIEDVKSDPTAKNGVYRMKKRLVESTYGVTIVEI